LLVGNPRELARAYSEAQGEAIEAEVGLDEERTGRIRGVCGNVFVAPLAVGKGAR